MGDSRVEDILQATIDSSSYNGNPQSRVERLLKELNELIEGGGGGGAIHPGGSILFEELPEPSEETLGFLYDISDSFTTTADFKEGAGKTYPAGTNVMIIDAGTVGNPVYMYDCMSGFVDLSNYVQKESGKGLSSNDYTTAEKEKLAGLSNYDDTALSGRVTAVETALDGHSVATDVPSNAVFTDTIYDDTALSGRVTAIETVMPSTATAQNKLSTAADVAGENISGSATGTAITLIDSADARVQGIGIKGKSRTTKNLLDENSLRQGNATGGATEIRVAQKNNERIKIKANTTYIIKRNTGDVQVSIGQIINGIETELLGYTSASSGAEFFSEQSGDILLIFRKGDNSSITIDEVKNCDFMLCTATDYEADPTFEPYGIHSVGDDGLTVQTAGKNLYDGSYSLTNAFLTDGGVVVYGSPSWKVSNWISITPERQYTISFKDANQNSAYVAFYDKNQNCVSSEVYTTNKTLTVTAPSNAKYFRTSISKVATEFQIEENSTATAYEPYRSTSADYITGLPLCSIPDTTIHDELNAGKEVVKQCGVLDLGDLTWEYIENDLSFSTTLQFYVGARTMICSKYECVEVQRWSQLLNNQLSTHPTEFNVIRVKDTEYSDATAFKAAVTGVKLIYPLATPTTTPLTAAEISAFRQLRTFDSTTNINITDEPEFTIDYLKNTDNGEAISRVVDLLQGADIKVFTYTGTGTVNHSTTFPEVPTMVLAMFGQHTFSSNTWSVSSRPFVWGVRPVFVDWCAVSGTSNGNQMMPATYNGAEITFSGMSISDPGASLNASGVVYTVLYLA